jgi:hypothetical protein
MAESPHRQHITFRAAFTDLAGPDDGRMATSN